MSESLEVIFNGVSRQLILSEGQYVRFTRRNGVYEMQIITPVSPENHCSTCQCNKLNDEANRRVPENPRSRSWHRD